MASERRGVVMPLRRPTGSSSDLSDEALMASCAVGESAALGALFDRHNEAVFRFLSRVAWAPSDDVEDLVQSTFLEVWRCARKYRGKGSARSWIFGVAVNLARHYVRGEVRRRAAMQGLAERPEKDCPRPDDRVADRELMECLEGAVSALPYDLRVAFVLCDIEEISGVEAARALGVRQGTMWRRLHDARKRIRRALDGGIA